MKPSSQVYTSHTQPTPVPQTPFLLRPQTLDTMDNTSHVGPVPQIQIQIMPEPQIPPGKSAAVSEETDPGQCLEFSEPYVDVGIDSLSAMTMQGIHAGQKGDLVNGPVLHFKSQEKKTKWQ